MAISLKNICKDHKKKSHNQPILQKWTHPKLLIPLDLDFQVGKEEISETQRNTFFVKWHISGMFLISCPHTLPHLVAKHIVLLAVAREFGCRQLCMRSTPFVVARGSHKYNCAYGTHEFFFEFKNTWFF